MKKMRCFLFWIVFAAAFVLSGCTKNENNPPTDVDFSEYSLSGTDCQWANLDYSDPAELIVINSDGELNNYLTCPEGSAAPAVDFSKHTLLLAFGVEPTENLPDFLNFQQVSTRSYVVNVNLKPSEATVVTKWHAAIVTAKLDENSSIKLRITRDIR